MKKEMLFNAAKKYGTPLYVFDLDILKEQTERIRAGFGPEISLWYWCNLPDPHTALFPELYGKLFRATGKACRGIPCSGAVAPFRGAG